MRKHIHGARDLILPVIDFFYPPFRRLMSLQTFRYAASGGVNTLLGFAVYFSSYKFFLKGDNLDLGFFAFKSHSAALFISFLITFPFGFFLMKYVVFNDSNMPGRIQLFRYFMIYLFNLALNYIILKVLVERVYVNAIVAQVITTVIIVLFSYIAQRYFTFKIGEDEQDITN
ncbi:MAG: GtrA family protein [Bacteroidota bacterium]